MFNLSVPLAPPCFRGDKTQHVSGGHWFEADCWHSPAQSEDRRGTCLAQCLWRGYVSPRKHVMRPAHHDRLNTRPVFWGAAVDLHLPAEAELWCNEECRRISMTIQGADFVSWSDFIGSFGISLYFFRKHIHFPGAEKRAWRSLPP